MSISFPVVEKRKLHYEVVGSLEEMMDKFGLDYDDLLHIIGCHLIDMHKYESHEGVQTCLIGAGENCLEASVDYYASTK